MNNKFVSPEEALPLDSFTRISFRVGNDEYTGRYHSHRKMFVDGVTSRKFSSRDVDEWTPLITDPYGYIKLCKLSTTC